MRNTDIKELVEIADSFTVTEVLEMGDTYAKIQLPYYNNLIYNLTLGDWYFLEALRIMFEIEVKTGEDGVEQFSSGDLINLSLAIKEDANDFGSLYLPYFFETPDYTTLTEDANKQYLLDYITFMERLVRCFDK